MLKTIGIYALGIVAAYAGLGAMYVYGYADGKRVEMARWQLLVEEQREAAQLQISQAKQRNKELEAANATAKLESEKRNAIAQIQITDLYKRNTELIANLGVRNTRRGASCTCPVPEATGSTRVDEKPTASTEFSGAFAQFLAEVAEQSRDADIAAAYAAGCYALKDTTYSTTF